MPNDTNRYFLQLRAVEASAPADRRRFELLALPEGQGTPFKEDFDHWDSVSDRLRTLTSSTPFHLKVIYRTLEAGLPADVINRSTGARQVFTLDDLGGLGLAS